MAVLTATPRLSPAARRAANTPLKVSPAPVVSRTAADGAGKCSACPSAFTISAPRPPIVTTTGARLTPASLRARSVMACRSSGESYCPRCALGCVWSSAATSALSSVALGVSIGLQRRSRRTAGTAGAGFKMHRTPAEVAASTAATIDSSGISVLTSTQPVRSTSSDRARVTCRAVTAEFAPAPTAIWFSPRGSTTIKATPVASPCKTAMLLTCNPVVPQFLDGATASVVCSHCSDEAH